MTYLKEKPKCKTCGKEMFMDDLDYNFKGCQDEYWICENCYDSLFVKVRYDKVVKTIYEKHNKEEVK